MWEIAPFIFQEIMKEIFQNIWIAIFILIVIYSTELWTAQYQVSKLDNWVKWSNNEIFCDLYTYKAKVIDCYDWDTCTVKTDLGFQISFEQTIRLLWIDAPEIRWDSKEEWIITRDWLNERIKWQEVIIKTQKDETWKFGRYLAEIYHNWINMNQEMLDKNLASIYE